MQDNERNKLIELTKKAVAINEELLADEKKFIAALSSDEDYFSVNELNEKLNELVSREHLYLAATKSLLQIINNK